MNAHHPQMMTIAPASPEYWKAIEAIAQQQSEAIAESRRVAAVLAAGQWLAAKAQQQVREVDVHQAARNLRKQGMPLDLALLVLVGRH